MQNLAYTKSFKFLIDGTTKYLIPWLDWYENIKKYPIPWWGWYVQYETQIGAQCTPKHGTYVVFETRVQLKLH